MLAELPESDASGEIAQIYADVRRLCAVPYVSSMQRHLATRAGWLEWAWSSIGPVFHDGRAQEISWRLAEKLPIRTLDPIPTASLRLWNVDKRDEESIGAVCETFIRASPTNLIFSGILRRLLAGERPGKTTASEIVTEWVPPKPTSNTPPLVAIEALENNTRTALMTFSTTINDTPFVPGLYRMLANWPGLLAHLATVLAPRLSDPETIGACNDLAQAIDEAAAELLTTLPPLADTPHLPPASDFPAVLAAVETYRKTSPQMVIYSTLIHDALAG